MTDFTDPEILTVTDQSLLATHRPLPKIPDRVAQWIAETEAEQAAAEKELRESQGRTGQILSEEEIAELVRKVDDLRKVIPNAEPRKKEELYARFGLKMTYCPGKNEVRTEIRFSPDCVGYPGVTDCVRGGT